MLGRSRRLAVTFGLLAIAMAAAPFTVSADPRVLADLCYRWLERPMIRRGRVVTLRRRTALDAGTRY